MELRWGICGCGFISGDFVNALSLLPDGQHKVSALGASSLDRAKQFSQKHFLKGCEVFGSYEELFACDRVDIIYIGLIKKFHHENVLKALKAGKHVLCETPLGLTVAQVTEMVACARENKRFLMEAFWARCFPVSKQIREEIGSGHLGDVKFLIADFGLLLEDQHLDSILKEKQGGFLMEFGCYPIQLAQMVFGGQKPTKITIDGLVHPGSDVNISGSITLSYPDNRLAQLLYSGSAPCECRAQVVGTKGRMMIPETLWCPTSVEKQMADGSKRETFGYVLPSKPGINFTYQNSAGLSYEADCVRECLNKGHTECPIMPLDESIMFAEILEECRRQLGIQL